MRYNPGFLTEEELVESFVVRREHLSLLMDSIRGNDGTSNQHLLIIGARGGGKTTLVRRLAVEIRRTPDLAAKWHPIVFGEESYEIFTAGEFWLAALFHLAGQTGDANLALTHKELLAEKDERRLRDRALGHLLDFADCEGKRLALVVENLNMLLGEQLVDGADWDIRHTLMNEPRLTLIGTATTTFDAIENSERAWFGLFIIHELRPLNIEECGTLWKSIVGEDNEAANYPMRPIEILTGGNPRLLGILAGFSRNRSFRDLLENLTDLIDEHTDYFKSRLEYLPATERKVFATVLDIWDPTTAREVADESRMDINKASAMLKRLLDRGAIMVMDSESGRKYYQASERLFNVYHLMRRRGETSGRVHAAVRFVLGFYEEVDAEEILKNAFEECPELKLDIENAKNLFLEKNKAIKTTKKIVSDLLSQVFFNLDEENLQECEEILDKLIAIEPDNSSIWDIKGQILMIQKKYRKAAYSFIKVMEIEPENIQNYFHITQAISKDSIEIGGLGAVLNIVHRSIKEGHKSDIIWIYLAFSLESGIQNSNYFWEDSLKKYGDFFIQNAKSYSAINATIDFITYIAAAGYTKETLTTILEVDEEKKFEPLEVGLRIYLGESPRRAHEILEVGKDVAQRIRELAEKRAAMIAESASPEAN